MVIGLLFTVLKRVTYSVCVNVTVSELQHCLPFTVYAEGCETAEEQSDDEAHTLQVPE